MIHLLGGTFHSTSNNKYYPILRVYNVVTRKKDKRPRNRTSFVIYQSLCYPDTFCISIVFKKCLPTARLHWKNHDCIIPYILYNADPSQDWFLSELARIPTVENSTAQRRIYQYTHDYMVNLVGALELWVKNRGISELQQIGS